MEEPRRTYTAREIVLELFPATDARLIPGLQQYQVERHVDGTLFIHVIHAPEQTLLLTPVVSAGNPRTRVSCDLCQQSAPRSKMQMFRLELPSSSGRRFRYVSLCRDVETCDARRIDDGPIQLLLAQALEP